MRLDDVALGIEAVRTYLRTFPEDERRKAVRIGIRFQVNGTFFWIRRIERDVHRLDSEGYAVWPRPQDQTRAKWVPGDMSSPHDVRPDLPPLLDALNLLLVEEVLSC